MFSQFRNLRFWTSAKNLPLTIKTPGVLLIRGETFIIRRKRFMSRPNMISGTFFTSGLLEDLTSMKGLHKAEKRITYG